MVWLNAQEVELRKSVYTQLFLGTSPSHDISSNTTERNTEMVDIKSMSTLSQSLVAYGNKSESNEFAVVAGKLETKRDVSVQFDSGDMVISLSSGINNNENSDDAALETAPDVLQVSQAIDEVCFNYSMMALSVNFCFKDTCYPPISV